MMRAMRAYQGMLSAIALIACIGGAAAQVSLRNRVDSSRTFQAIRANSVLEFLSSGGYTYVAFGGAGLAIYRYQQGQPPQRVGYHYSASLSGITDLAFGPHGSLACVSGTNVYLFSFRASDQSLVPHGVAVSQNAGLNAARVRALRDTDIANDAYLIVGTRTGRLRVYRLTVQAGGELPAAPSLETPLNVGNPLVDVPLFSDSVRALAAWEYPTGQPYIAVGGSDGMVYLYRFGSGSLTPIGKAMYHPAPVEEIVVNGNRLIVGLRNGLVYVWNYTASSVSHHLTIKEPWSPLTAYSLCALPNDRVAVATGSVRVYSLANGAQVGEYGAHVYGDIYSPNYYYAWYYLSMPYSFASLTNFYPQPLVRLAPFVGSNNNYFYVAGVQYNVRTSFLPPPASLSYQTIGLPWPAYAVAHVAGTSYAIGLANGEVRAFGSSRNVGAPVFSLMPAGSASQPWLFGSYGVGNVFAWSGSGTFVSNILPAASSPRIVYSLRLISVSGTNNNLFTFATAGSDGKVQVWRWDSSTPNTLATLLSEQSLPYPLHSLSVNANRSSVAVASLNAPFSSAQRCAWTLSLSSSGALGAPTPLDQPARVVAYHPSNPDLLATAGEHLGWSGRGAIYLLRPSQQPHFLGTSHLGFITSLGWLSTDLLAASDSAGLVYLFSPNGALNNPLNRDGTTQNIYYGNPGDALRAVYQPHRGYVYEISAAASGLATAGADRTVSVFSNSGLPVHFIQLYDSYIPLTSIDYLPNGGVALTHAMVYPSSNQAYSLFASPPGYVAFWVPNTASAVYVNPVVQEIQNNQLRVGQAFVAGSPGAHIYGETGYRVELSENGQYGLVARLEDWSVSNPGRARAWILSRSTSFPYFSGNRYTLYQYTSTNDPFRFAFSPSGSWVALTVNANTINVYQRSAITSDNPPRHSAITYSTAPQVFIALKFLADDVLAVWQRTNNINYLDIWQLSGTTWTLRQSINTGIDYVFTDYTNTIYYPIDAVQVGSVVRVALGGANTLVFYRLDRPSGVPNLTEVGRTTLTSNGYLDMPHITWVRFSRQNPNVLGVAQVRTIAITYDLTGLFSW
jgi:WD40 repeat protein